MLRIIDSVVWLTFTGITCMIAFRSGSVVEKNLAMLVILNGTTDAKNVLGN